MEVLYAYFRYLTLLLIISFSNGIGVAQECLGDPEALPHGPAYGIALSDSTAVMGNGTFVTTLDISDPEDPKRLTSLDLGTLVWDVATHLDHAFVTTGYVVEVVDISYPKQPHQIGEIECPGAGNITISDGIAYVAGHKLCIIDVSDPVNPITLSTTSGFYPEKLTLVGQTLYDVASPWVQAFDVSNPRAPQNIWSLKISLDEYEYINSVAVFEEWVYVIGSDGLYIIDSTKPSAPRLVKHDPGPQYGNDLFIIDERMYILAPDVLVYDLEDPENPRFEGYVDVEVHNVPYTMAIDQNLGYLVAGDAHLRVLRFDSEDLPMVIGAYETFWIFTAAYIDPGTMLKVAGRLGAGPAYLQFIDIHDLSNPIKMASITVPRWSVVSLTIEGSTAFVNMHDGVMVIDISDPSQPEELGRLNSSDSVVDLAVQGSRAFLANNDLGLTVVDLSDPSSMVEIGRLSSTTRAVGISVQGSLAAVSVGRNGLVIVDISNPESPRELSRIETLDYCPRATIVGSRVFMADSEGGLRIIDISNPEQPVDLGTVPTVRKARDIVFSGDLMLVADGYYGARLFKIDEEIIEIGAFITPGGAFRVDMNHARALLVAGGLRGGLYTFDLSGCTAASHTTWIEIAAQQEGLHGSSWSTDLVIANANPENALVQLVFTDSNGEYRLTGSVAGNGQGVFEDVVSTLGAQGTGTLEILSDQPVTATARIFSRSGQGTFGQLFLSVNPEDGLKNGEQAALYGLRQYGADFRSNLSVTNTSDQPANVIVTLLKSNGDSLTSFSIRVEARSVHQIIQPFSQHANDPNIGWGFAIVEVTDGTGVFTSGSVIDNRTNDATTVPMQVLQHGKVSVALFRN